MSIEGASKPLPEPASPPVPERASRLRQRQRLIDACISALHIYGPSRTTVERVVALADMSPGIVRFYFESKVAMLVASLEFLAAEFEQRVLEPVAALKATPVQALELLVELYLDADIASPRKVSVWYCFWGEASSRQEYLQICGKKDEDFEALVRELMQRMIEQSGEPHLDADGVALGLMGALEVLWQNIAFQTEAHIDRPVAKRRVMNYLRSLFPRQFAHAASNDDALRARAGLAAAPRPPLARLPAWAYADTALLALEREQLFRAAWQIAGHVAGLARPGAYLTIDLPTERALLLRDQTDAIRAFHNTCRHRPHTLLAARAGTIDGTIACTVHDLHYGYDGRVLRGETPGDLLALELVQQAGLILVRPADGARAAAQPLCAWSGWQGLHGLHPSGEREIEVAADWKLIVEQWLESALAQQPRGSLGALVQPPVLQLAAAAHAVEWQASLRATAPGWSADHYVRLAQRSGAAVWQRLFMPPNQLIEIRPEGALLLQVLPDAPGRCRIRRIDLCAAHGTRIGRAMNFLSQRLIRRWLEQDVALAASIQSGLKTTDEEATEAGPVPPALVAFRQSVFSLLTGA